MQSSTLLRLLQLTWRSPVFGDAYPTAKLTRTSNIINQIGEVHTRFLTRLEPVLRQGMPGASAADVQEIIRQIAPKSTAFCSAIAAGEVHDVERLCAAAVSIALVYWADQSMDRGDEAMVAAVHSLNGQGQSALNGAAGAIRTTALARRNAVQQIEAEVLRLSRPEDTPVLLECVFKDTLPHEARMRELSELYLQRPDSTFWDRYADEVAYLSIINGAFLYVTAAIYSIYRHQRPYLPSLVEVFEQPGMMAVLRGAGNAAIRIFDDLGDRHIDGGAYPEWGEFYLNIFNQPDPRLVTCFLYHSGVEDKQLRRSLLAAFEAGDHVNRMYIVRVFADLVRDRVSRLPAATWQRYGTFLTLSKRVIEAGYVNMLGDKELAGTGPLLAERVQAAEPASAGI